MQAPKVSVLIPAYNYAHYLGEAIESVLEQTFGDIELIVVDNCSTDNTVELVHSYMEKDPRVKLVVNKTNVGMFRNYNESLLHATGECIKFLNADDKFDKTLLQEFVSILDKHPNVSLVTSWRQFFGTRDKVLKSGHSGLCSGKAIIMESIERSNFIGEPTTVMFRRENLNLGLFDPSLLMFADYDMWLRHLGVGDIYFVDKVLSYFRCHDTQGTEELNRDTDKQIFNILQFEEYRRYALQTNRYGYDFTLDEPERVKRFIKKRIYGNHRLLFHKTKYRDKVRLYLGRISIRAFLKFLFGKSHLKRMGA